MREVMKIARRGGAVSVLIGSALLFGVVGPGCNNNGADPAKTVKKFVPPKEEKRTALDVQARDAVIAGRIVYDGEPPPLERIVRIDLHGDKDVCNQGTPAEQSKQGWFVNKENRGVRYGVVWVEPPPGKYFPLTEKEKDRKNELVVVDQPHCAFIPHVVAVFPSYFDGDKQEKTGQVLEVRNSSPVLHTIQWDISRENTGVMRNLPPRGKPEQFVVNQQKKPIYFGCGAHNWMLGYMLIFEHPYHAVTAEDGSFEIKNLPSDVELTFKAWHESSLEPFEVRKVTLKKGDNPPIELKIKAPERKTNKK